MKEELIKAIEEWHNNLAPLVKKNSQAIKNDLIKRANSVNDLDNPDDFRTMKEIMSELEKLNDVNTDLGNLFKNR